MPREENPKLRELDEKLSKWTDRKAYKTKPTKKSVEKQINSILTGGYMKRIIRVQNIKRDGIQRIEYDVDQEELEKIMKHELGRTLIISTRKKWDEKEIINSYRGMYSIESAFKNMKHQEFLHWQPAYHWTDTKIQVHALYCVLALLLASLAHKKVQKAGINISLPSMLEELSKIREVALIYSKGPKSKQKCQLTLSSMSPKQKKLADSLEIAEALKG